jgi:hypothetical protein
VAASRGDKAPDPLGKQALFWVPESSGQGALSGSGGTISLPSGKRALFSAAPVDPEDVIAISGNPIAERGSFTVECQRCSQTSHVGVVDLLIYQFPVGLWRPRRRFDHRMTCPSCRRRTWCSVTLRRS